MIGLFIFKILLNSSSCIGVELALKTGLLIVNTVRERPVGKCLHHTAGYHSTALGKK